MNTPDIISRSSLAEAGLAPRPAILIQVLPGRSQATAAAIVSRYTPGSIDGKNRTGLGL